MPVDISDFNSAISNSRLYFCIQLFANRHCSWNLSHRLLALTSLLIRSRYPLIIRLLLIPILIVKLNKTIKDGDISPWLIWNNLSTWSYGKIWTKRQENLTEKILNYRNGEDGRALLIFAADLRAFGAHALPNTYKKLFVSNASILFYHLAFGILDYLGLFVPYKTILN